MDFGIEMNAVEHLIDAHQQLIVGVPFQDREIIALGKLNEIGRSGL